MRYFKCMMEKSPGLFSQAYAESALHVPAWEGIAHNSCAFDPGVKGLSSHELLWMKLWSVWGSPVITGLWSQET